MRDKEVQITFDAPAVLRKWPSVNNERVSASLGARPYLIIDGSLDAFADIAEQRPNTAEMIFFMNRFHSLGDGSVTPQCGRSTPALRSDSDVAAFRVGLLH